MDRKHIGTVAIVVALLVVIYLSTTENLKDNPHPPREEWIKKHKITVQRNGNPERFCFKCHGKRGETKENFCNVCHAKAGVKKLD